MSKKVKKENNDSKKMGENEADSTPIQPEKSWQNAKKEDNKARSSLKDKRETELEEKIASLEKEIEVLKEKYLRSLADLDNQKKEQKRELEREKMIMEERTKYGNEKLINQLLFFPDNYETAMQSLQQIEQNPNQNLEIIREKNKRTLEGLQMVLMWFQNFLRKQAVEEIKVIPGKDIFDATIHYSPEGGDEENNDCPDGTILQVLRKGYKIHGRVLRPTMVKISKKTKEIENQKKE